jgi:hypothetical protein
MFRALFNDTKTVKSPNYVASKLDYQFGITPMAFRGQSLMLFNVYVDNLRATKSLCSVTQGWRFCHGIAHLLAEFAN